MKKFSVALFIILPLAVMSQNIKVVYDIVSDGKINKTVLEANDSISVYGLITKSDPSSFFIKLKNQSRSYSTNRITNVRFYVKDSLHSMQWQLGNDTMRLLNQLCLSAKTAFRGRHYNAYYAPGIPLSDGPWKFGGLPGLILWIKADDGYAEWRATEMTQNADGKIDASATTAHPFLEWVDFVAAYKDVIQKYTKLLRSNGTLDSQTTAQLKITSLEIFFPELQTGDGITY
ncbi:MAG TPA: GLPGLI family protein [Flavisolibacter sp.]|jgi:GLPGLI family protein|nr:GLPGLI family protein [Flavisolibacter sp.]